jgi:PAS domain S-box-containing protein
MADSKKTKKELIEAVEALQESEKKWHLLAENVPDVILTVGKDSRIQFLNRTVAGYDPESAIGTTIYEYVPPDQHHIMRESIERVFLTGKPDSYEIDGVGEHGLNTRWETRVVPIMRDGQVVAANLISTDITEHKKAEEALRQSEEKYRSLITNIPDVTWTTDCEGKTTFISPNIEKVYGFTPEEVYRGGSHIWFGRVHPDDVEHIKEAYESLFTENKIFDVEYRIQRKDGRWIWLRDRAVATYEKNGVMYADGIFSDITEHEKITDNLRKTRERLEYILATSPATTYTCKVGGDWSATFISENIKEQFGYEPHQFLEDGFWATRIHPDDRQRVLTQLSVLIENDFHTHEYRFLHKDGSYRWVLDEVRLIRDEGGKPVECIGYWTDITKRKKAEEALLVERDKAQGYLDIAGVMLIAINSEQAVKLINKRGCKILGYKEEEIIGKNWFDNFVPERSRDEVEKVFQRLMAGEAEPVEYYENSVITKSGEEKIIAWHNTVLKNEQGDTVGTLSSAQDITEFKQIERREREHQAELAHFSRLSTIGEMSSALAHELNQPLCAIASSAKAALRMMKSGDWDSNELLEAMEEAGAQAERAGKIIHRTTKLVRKKEPHRSRVNIENIIDEVITLVEHEALLREITIHLVEPSEKLPMLEADAIQIEQVLLNLLRNSFEAMDNIKGSRHQVTIGVSMGEDDTVQVAISDTGEGLPAENIDMVFEHFFTTKSEGLGMGLSISRSIIEAHGGRIWAEHNPAGGATFRFTLPAGRGIS